MTIEKKLHSLNPACRSTILLGQTLRQGGERVKIYTVKFHMIWGRK